MSRTGSFPWTVWKIFFSFILSPLLFLPHSSEYQAVSFFFFFFFLTMTQDLYNRDKFFQPSRPNVEANFPPQRIKRKEEEEPD
jgi:hypothetical protein